MRMQTIALFLVTVVTSVLLASAQTSPGEHESHHPGNSPAANPPALTPPSSADLAGNPSFPDGRGSGERAGGGPGMGGGAGMDGMMEQMGVPKPKELYPSLMAMPDLPMERRSEVQAQAIERMNAGLALVQKGVEDLSDAFRDDHPMRIEEAKTLLGEGLSRFESGFAARQALAEGKVPRNVALRWFKREMNLFPLETLDENRWFGLAPKSFHFVVIAILASSCALFVWMYFFKMRRAATILQGITASRDVTSASSAKSVAPTSLAIIPASRSTTDVPSTPKDSVSRPTRWKGTLQIVRIFEETASAKTFRLANPNGGPIPFQYLPGQFLTLSLQPQSKLVRRSYTIASSPTQRDYVEITVKREDMGEVSRYLHDRVSEGTTLEIAAPSGRFTFTGEDSRSIVLIAGGVGITPMMSVLRYLTDRAWRGDIHLFYGCRETAEFIFRDEIEYRRKRFPNLHVVLTVSREQHPQSGVLKGRVDGALLSSHVPELQSARVHVCGPNAMMTSVERALLDLGLPPNQVLTEKFGTAKEARSEVDSESTEGEPSRDLAVSLPTVSFVRSGKSSPLDPAKTVLDVADEIGVEIDNSCREGTCGTCKVKLLAGEVTMDVDDGLDPEDRTQNIILACQAKSRQAVSVDA